MTRAFSWKIPTIAIAATLAVVLAFVPRGAEAHHLHEAGLELTGVVEVVGGWMHTCARTADGEVYCWGNNATGNLGDGTAANVRPVPARVDGIGTGPVRQVSAGADHSCALSNDQDVWCWGGNLSGQLGGIPADLGLVRRTPGKVTHFQAATHTPKFKAVSAGNTHSCALETTGDAWCWGSNTFGQLGSGSILSGAQPAQKVDQRQSGLFRTVIAGGSHSCGINLGNEVWCWGENQDGRLGDDSTVNRYTPVRVHSTNGFPAGGVVTLALGSNHTCATTQAQSVYCWGSNTHGRIGSASANPAQPTAQGPDSRVPQRVTRYQGEAFTGLVGVTAGLDHSCAWQADGVGWCWGRNLYGHLGDGIVSTSQPRPRYDVQPFTYLLEPTGAIQSISAGYNHTCSLNAGAIVHCWGHNGLGQGGDGTFVFHNEPAKVFRPAI